MLTPVVGALPRRARPRRRPASHRLFDRLELAALRLFARVWHRWSGNGRAPLPLSGPAIVVANHPSHADPAFLMAGSPRVIHFLQARRFYDDALLRPLFRTAGCIPVARDGHDVAGVRAALRDLQNGAVVGIFIEGEVTPEGTTRQPRRGAAFLALRTGAPVYPALIRGGPRTGHILGDWLRPSKGVHVVYGPAIHPPRPTGQRIGGGQLDEWTAIFARRIEDLRSRELGGTPVRWDRPVPQSLRRARSWLGAAVGNSPRNCATSSTRDSQAPSSGMTWPASAT